RDEAHGSESDRHGAILRSEGGGPRGPPDECEGADIAAVRWGRAGRRRLLAAHEVRHGQPCGDAPGGRRMSTPLVQLDHATLGYGRRVVLSDLTFDIPPGDFLGLVGPNGAGKTTI